MLSGLRYSGTSGAPMARKRKGPTPISKLTRNVASRKRKAPRRRPRPRRVNPEPAAKSKASMLQGFGELVIPGIAAYAGTRLAGRIAYKLGRKKSARFAKHAGALTPPLIAVGAFVAAHKSDRLAAYRDGLIIGSTIAGIQALVQAYLPQYGWILNDYHLDDVLPQASKAAAAQPLSEPATPVPDYDDYTDLIPNEDPQQLEPGNEPVDLSEFYAGSLSSSLN